MVVIFTGFHYEASNEADKKDFEKAIETIAVAFSSKWVPDTPLQHVWLSHYNLLILKITQQWLPLVFGLFIVLATKTVPEQ